MIPIPVHAANPTPLTGDGNWTWLLPGRVPTLIDAGTGEPRHLEALDAALRGAALAQVLVTHAHSDHASGAPVLVERMHGPRMRKMPWPGRDEHWPAVYEPIADGESILAGDTSLVAIHTPGHSPDHLSFWHEDTRVLFCGDLAVQGSSVFVPASLGGDLTAYLRSLERVLALRPVRMYPAHGPVIEDPEPLLRGYVEHRLKRELQVLGCLGAGLADVDEMVGRIYAGLKASLMPFAKESVLSHLVKLEREGRARRHGEQWVMSDPTT